MAFAAGPGGEGHVKIQIHPYLYFSVGKGKTYRIEKEELPMLLRNTLKITPQAEWIGDGPISRQHREGEDYDLFFLLNSGPEILGGKILLRAVGGIELRNADTG